MYTRCERFEHMVESTCDIFSERLDQFLNEEHINRSQLERDGVCARDSLRLYVNGDKMPNGRTLLYLCNYLNVNPDWLLGFSDEKKKVWT